MGTTVEVVFNKEDKMYWAGELLKGNVIVETDDEKSLKLIKGLRVRCRSQAIIDLKFGGGEDVINIVDWDAKILSEKVVRTTKTVHNDEIVRLEYPFQFQLEKHLPSSFITPYGKIEYFMKASLPSGVAASYYEGKGQFNVMGLLDLNAKKSLRKPVELKLEATMTTILLAVSGVVNFYLRLPHKAYAIGDHIELHQEIENKSKQHVKASISLIQKITYELMGRKRLDKENKMKIFGKEVMPESKDVTVDQTFKIPNVPITSEIRLKTEGKTIKIAYFLKYEMVGRPGWTKKMKGYIPITIGSIGFKRLESEAGKVGDGDENSITSKDEDERDRDSISSSGSSTLPAVETLTIE